MHGIISKVNNNALWVQTMLYILETRSCHITYSMLIQCPKVINQPKAIQLTGGPGYSFYFMLIQCPKVMQQPKATQLISSPGYTQEKRPINTYPNGTCIYTVLTR